MSPSNTPRPSATVMMIRDHDDGIEVLMVQRSQQLKTNAGAWVFPGGNVDENDFAQAKTLTENSDQPISENAIVIPDGCEPLDFFAAQEAAVREVEEETSINVEIPMLTPFAHWTTPKPIPRRYATWFFLVYAKEGFDVTVDGSEIVGYRWSTPDRILNLHRSGEMSLTPPTFVSLQQLLPFQHSEKAYQYLDKVAPVYYNPRLNTNKQIGDQIKKGENIFNADGLRVILYEGDAGYESADAAIHGDQHRLIMNGNDWQYIDNYSN